MTVLNLTPSAFEAFDHADAVAGGPAPISLRFIIFGGEALEFTRLAPWLERHGDLRPQLINMYGITETTVHVTYRRVLQSDVHRRRSRIPDPAF